MIFYLIRQLKLFFIILSWYNLLRSWYYSLEAYISFLKILFQFLLLLSSNSCSFPLGHLLISLHLLTNYRQVLIYGNFHLVLLMISLLPSRMQFLENLILFVITQTIFLQMYFSNSNLILFNAYFHFMCLQ